MVYKIPPGGGGGKPYLATGLSDFGTTRYNFSMKNKLCKLWKGLSIFPIPELN